MPLNSRDSDVIRRDARFNHSLLTPQDRIRVLEPYLPTPPSRSPSRTGAHWTTDKKSRLGVRRFLRSQLHALTYTIIHAIFSLWMSLRHVWHILTEIVISFFNYHHRTPALIERDVKALSRLPKHISVILNLDGEGKGGAELEKLVDETAEVVAWTASAGIPMVSIYERTGVLKGYLPEVHRALSQKLSVYFGPKHPALTLQAPNQPAIESTATVRAGQDASDEQADSRHVSVLLISEEDGRESLVDLTKTLAEMAQRSKITPADVSIDLIDAELTEGVMGEPDLLVLFGPYPELSGYPPWQSRLVEIFHVRDNHSVGYQVFYRALCKYAGARFNLGR